MIFFYVEWNELKDEIPGWVQVQVKTDKKQNNGQV